MPAPSSPEMRSMRASSIDPNGRPHYKEGIRLAEMGKWSTLVSRLQAEPQLARHRDHHGMLPLHWACTEDDVPPDVVQALLRAFPEGVVTKNNAQYLPLHIAVRARVGEATLRLLCEARPSTLLEESPSGKTPLQLAQELNLPEPSMHALRDAERAYMELSEEPETSEYEDTKREIMVQSQRLRESMMQGPQQSGGSMSFSMSTGPGGMVFPSKAREEPDEEPAPRKFTGNETSAPTSTNSKTEASEASAAGATPKSTTSSSNNNETQSTSLRMDAPPASVQKSVMIEEEPETMFDQARFTPSMCEDDAHNADVCGVCNKKFSMFRKQYQCKGCFVYLCKKHVAGKLELPNHTKKRSVCGDCYRIHRNGPVASQSRSNNNNNSARNARAGSGPNRANPNAAPGSERQQQQQNQNQNQHPYSDDSIVIPNTSSTRGTQRYRAESTQSITSRQSNIVGPQANMRYSDHPANRQRVESNGTHNGTSFSQPWGYASGARSHGRLHTETTVSLTDSDHNYMEVALLQQRIAELEDHNQVLVSRVAEQEKQYNEAMLLLTQTMTRVAEIEIRLPGVGLKRDTEIDDDGDIAAAMRMLKSEPTSDSDLEANPFNFPTDKFD